MTHVLLLVLVGAVSAVGPQTGANDQRAAGVQAAPGTQAAPTANPFGTAPLELSHPILKSPFRATHAPKLRDGAGQDLVALAQSRQKQPSAVCSIQVMRADPSLDPGFVFRMPAETMDRIVRQPPCVAPQSTPR